MEVCLYGGMSVWRYVCLSICLSVSLSVCVSTPSLFQIIVSESQFAEGGGGRKHLMGSIVTDDGSVIGGSALPSKWGESVMIS